MLLSICIAGKNDNLHRNYLWRLETTIQRFTNLFKKYNSDAEILFLDWGSESKIKDCVRCDTSLVKWLYVPKNICDKIDSNFPSTIAYNSCLKRANGEFVFQCDSETFISEVSFQRMMTYLKHTKELGRTNSQVVGVNRNTIIETFCSTCPTEFQIERYLLEKYNEPDISVSKDAYLSASESGFGGGMAGILIGKEAFCDSTGWDERHIHWGWSDIEHNKRLSKRLKMFQSTAFGFLVWHMNHQKSHEFAPRCNNNIEPTKYKANDEKTWGLAGLNLEDESICKKA